MRKQHCEGSYVQEATLAYWCHAQGERAIEHVAESDRQQKPTGSFPLDLEIGVGVIVCPNQTSRWGPNGRRGVALLIPSTVGDNVYG